MRIATGGFHIESCTFSPLLTRRDDFLVLRGHDLLQTYDFITKFADVEVVPLAYARALPGGPVDKLFYEAIKAEILSGLREKDSWDGVFLHLHGAATVEGLDDAEGDLVAAIRQVVGPDCMLAASYDLHGNVSQSVVDHLDLLSAYRTAPHVDWYETLKRVFTLLVECCRQNLRPYKTFIPIPILLPGEQTSTEWEPAASLYNMIPKMVAGEGVMDASILVGYVWADEPRATASVLAFGLDQAAVQHAAFTLAQRYWDVRHQFRFNVPTGSVDECIQMALATPEYPVVISDSGDNPTAGGAGDVPYVLERLLALNVPEAVYASLPDPAAVAICHQAGIGAEVELSLGGKLDPVNGVPSVVKGRVLTIETQPWSLYGAANSRESNNMAVVQVQGVKVIITEQRTPFHHLADFQRLNIEPTNHKIVVVKIGYLEPELKQMASKALLAFSPGAVNQDIKRLAFKRIKRPMYPFDPDTSWSITGA
jgi:microcystin degradation protein MlrC